MTNATVQIAADFGDWIDYPLVKTKFAVFNSGIVRLDRYARDIDHFRAVNPESLRIDLGWGTPWIGWPQEPVSGTPDDIRYDFSEMDAIAKLMNSANVLPYWSYCYTPIPLQQPPGDWQSIPVDFAKWGDIIETFARHYQQMQNENPVGYHEICNEPDNDVFFKGSLHDYLEMYREGALAARRADPDALTGGPGLAFTLAWIEPFLDYVSQHQLPLDFFSYHWYGDTNYGGITFRELMQIIRRAFANRQEFATTELHLNEFNSYPIDYPIGGRQEKFALASAFLQDYKYFIEQPDITLVHWAQFLDSGQGNYSGMISMDGYRRAIFNAYQLYAGMPVDRYAVDLGAQEGVDGLASADESKVSLIFWNRSDADQTAAVAFKNVPFEQGDLTIYRIDAEHASWGDNTANEQLIPVETAQNISTAFGWVGSIPRDGVVCIELKDSTAPVLETPFRARFIRTLRFYPDRSKSAYADFDKNTWTARLGMVSENLAEAIIGVTAVALPDVFEVRFRIGGVLRCANAKSLLGLRVDYEVADIYVKSILFQGAYNGIDCYRTTSNPTPPWGTRRAPDQVIRVDNLARFQVGLTALAPDRWSGRAQITYLMQNTGTQTRAKVTFHPVASRNSE